ncbi:MAG: hypothetical protein II657_05960 [Clostridiales bacterium]|jgi:hypothetical protein|nr:hypothetical protein [Clostridiales bacterium]
MDMWNEKLTRENIEQFYDMYAAFAYRCAYKNLRDTTRAEMCVVDAFIDTYHKRAKLSEEKVIYYFSDALQYHVNELAGRYPVINDSAPLEKNLDEYTATTMKHSILEKIDSPRFRIAEFMASSSDNKIRRNTPLADYFQNSGITVMLLIKLVILAIVIAVTTYFGAVTFFHANNYIQNRTQRGTYKLEEYIVGILDYLPVSIGGNGAAAPTAPPQSDPTENTESTAPSSETEGTSEPSATVG